jgi:hypothetical protein
MPNQIVKLEAPADKPLYLWFEPWAEGLSFPPRCIVELHAASDSAGELEFDEGTESTTVYAWPGSTLEVLVDGRVVLAFDHPVPSGLTREMVSLVFGEPPTPTEGEKSLHRKPWWRLWH